LGGYPRRTAPTEFLWSLYANEFNKEFLDGAYLSGLDPSVTLTEFDMFALFNDAIGNPADYGLTNVSDACLPSEGPMPVGPPCAEPEAFLFWDIVHPTARAHQIIRDQFYRAVPEPSFAALLIVALGVLAARHKRL
jgi:phospholipase/lecithinase/hemolysin